MPILPDSAYQFPLPEMVKIKQRFQDEKIDNISAAVEKEIFREDVASQIKKGQSVAVLVGSRGIRDIKEIVKTTIDCLHKMGAKPFIVPAMGSHGGATVEGQKAVLEGYGITEQYIGAPIRATMETVIIGKTDSGVPVHMDKFASEADAIVPVARIKPHTDFDGPIQSGICKMLTVGAGKHNGCFRFHQEGLSVFSELIPKAAGIVIREKNVVFSVAIVENAHDNTNIIRAIPGDNIIAEEPKLLAISEALMPRLMFEEIDILIVGKIGKSISGTGMDTNITGKTAFGYVPWGNAPKIKRIIVLSIADDGNATGIGVADFITKRAFEQIDFTSTYANAIASVEPESVRIPVMMEDEEQALRAAILTSQKTDYEDVKIVKIEHTLNLIDIEVSRNLLKYCKNSDKFEMPQR